MLTYHMEHRNSESRYYYIYKMIKKDIQEGKLKKGEKLPSKRALAEHLGVSLITVENAYQRLKGILRRGREAAIMSVRFMQCHACRNRTDSFICFRSRKNRLRGLGKKCLIFRIHCILRRFVLLLLLMEKS